MPPLGEFESWSTYERNRRQITEKKAQAAAQAETSEYVAIRHAEAEQPNPILSALGLLERPGAAARGFFGTPADPLGGALRGLTEGAEAVPSGQDINRRLGLNLPTENIGPLPFSPAQAAGFVTAAALDPLSSGPLGGGVRFARAPFEAAGLLRRGGAGAALSAAGGLAEPVSVAEELARGTARTGLGAVTQRLPFVERFTDAFSPRIADQPGDLAAILHASSAADDAGRSWLESTMSRFKAAPLTGADKLAPEPWGDVLGDSAKWGNLSQHGQVWARAAQNFLRQAEDQWDTAQAALAKTAPKLAEKYDLEKLPDYFPRYMEGVDETGKRIIIPIGSRRGLQFERSFKTQAEGEAKGFRYVDPETALENHFREMRSKITEMQTLEALAKSPYGKYADDLALRDTKEQLAASAHRFAVIRDFEGVVSRAIRGERVPPVTLRKFSAEYPQLFEEAKKIGLSWPETDQAGVWMRKPTGGTYIQFLDDLRSTRETEKSFLDDLKKIGQGERAVATAGRAGLSQIPTERGVAFQGLWFDPEDAAEIGKYLGREQAFSQGLGTGASLARGTQGAFRNIRAIQASGDLSYALLQNLPALARNPAAGLAAIAQGIRTVVNPQEHSKFLAQPWVQDTIRFYGGMAVSGSEIRAEGFVRQIPVLGGIIGRSQEAWDMMGDAARVYMGDALRPMVEREIASGNARAVGEAVDYLSHATGVISTRGIGIGPGQRALEDVLLFAPRYLRASVALVGDMFGNGVQAREAQKTIASMLVSGAWGYQRIADGLGQEPVWDPADSRFMTVDVLGQRVGIGGTYRSLANLLGKVVAHPERTLDLNAFDPENQNPILRFWRGRISVPGQKAWDIISKEDFIGRPIDGPVAVATYAGTSLLPFAIANIVESIGRQDIGQAAVGTAATGAGLRAFPEGFTDVANRVARRDFGGRTYDELDEVERAKVQQSPEVKALPSIEGQRGARSRQVQGYFDQYTAEVDRVADQVAAGQETTTGFRQRVAEAAEKRNILLDAVPADPRAKPPDSLKAAYQRWIELGKEQGEFGRPDYEAQDAYRENLPPAVQKYIDDRLEAGLERLSPQAQTLMRELRAARDLLRPYRELRQTQLERADLWDEWNDGTPAERVVLEKSPKFRNVMKIVNRQKELMRRREPEVDEALVRFHGATPIRSQRR